MECTWRTMERDLYTNNIDIIKIAYTRLLPSMEQSHFELFEAVVRSAVLQVYSLFVPETKISVYPEARTYKFNCLGFAEQLIDLTTFFTSSKRVSGVVWPRIEVANYISLAADHTFDMMWAEYINDFDAGIHAQHNAFAENPDDCDRILTKMHAFLINTTDWLATHLVDKKLAYLALQWMDEHGFDVFAPAFNGEQELIVYGTHFLLMRDDVIPAPVMVEALKMTKRVHHQEMWLCDMANQLLAANVRRKMANEVDLFDEYKADIIASVALMLKRTETIMKQDIVLTNESLVALLRPPTIYCVQNEESAHILFDQIKSILYNMSVWARVREALSIPEEMFGRLQPDQLVLEAIAEMPTYQHRRPTYHDITRRLMGENTPIRAAEPDEESRRAKQDSERAALGTQYVSLFPTRTTVGEPSQVE